MLVQLKASVRPQIDNVAQFLERDGAGALGGAMHPQLRTMANAVLVDEFLDRADAVAPVGQNMDDAQLVKLLGRQDLAGADQKLGFGKAQLAAQER